MSVDIEKCLEMLPIEFFSRERCLAGAGGSSATASRMMNILSRWEEHKTMRAFLIDPKMPGYVRYIPNFGRKCRHGMVAAIEAAGLSLPENWNGPLNTKWW